MTKPIISIIIPIYNVEKYVKECLTSVLDQMNSNVQVICINDGTPDQSMSIVRHLISGYNSDIQQQFIFIDQENQGLSAARNTGLDAASGKYIGFLDSDDRLSKDYIETIFSCIDESEPDIIDFNLITSEDDIIHTRKGDCSSLDSIFKAGAWYSCARVVKKKIINKYRFIDDIYYEDLAFSPALYINARSTIHIDSPLYWYRLNDEGITMTINKQGNIKTIESLETILNYYLELYTSNNNPYYTILIIQSYFLLCINACRRISLKESISYANKYKNKISNLNIIKKDFNKRALDSKVKYFYNSPLPYLFLYNTYCTIKFNRLNYK